MSFSAFLPEMLFFEGYVDLRSQTYREAPVTSPVGFKKADLRRALAAAKQEGLKVAAVRFPAGGGFSIITADAPDEEASGNKRDEVLGDGS